MGTLYERKISESMSGGGDLTCGAKKDCPKDSAFEQSRPGLAPRNVYMIIIANSRQNASPNPDKRGGISPMSWAMILTYIGAAGLVHQLFRLIDWIERREDGRTEKLLGRDSR